jgi:hypothetical protein
MRVQSIIHYLKIISSGYPPLALYTLWDELRRRCYSNELAYGLRFDLSRPFDIPKTEPPLSIRELLAEDVPLLLNLRRSDISLPEFRFIIVSMMFIKAHLPTCYVGVTPENYPCCMCWLVTSRDYYIYRELFGFHSYPLQPDEVYVDNIFAGRDVRGKRLMKFMTLRLFEKAMQGGAKHAIAFISAKNTSSLAGSRAIGWMPFTIKRVRWRLFRNHTTFEPAPGVLPIEVKQ